MCAPGVELVDVTFGYGPAQPIVTQFSQSFSAGRVNVLTGPSGSGKSTLLYLFGLLLRPNLGEIVIDGIATARLNDAHRSALRATAIGFVFQDAALDATRTVLANVEEGAGYSGARRAEVRERATSLMQRFGVELRPSAKPGQVSGGQAARVGLCRALVKDPRVILADEPTGNLDADSAATVLDALQEAAERGCTVMVASHDDRVVQRWGVALKVGAP